MKGTTELDTVFKILGSAINPVLTQLAKTRKVVFVEGLDFQLLARFARKLGLERLANRSDFAVVPVEGFSPDRIRTLKKGMEVTLGSRITAAAILDRDYRSDAELNQVISNCDLFCEMTVVHKSKELENFVLVPSAIDHAAAARLADRARRGGQKLIYQPTAESALQLYMVNKKNYVFSQFLSARRTFERATGSGVHEATLNHQVLDELEERWSDPAASLQMIPGKEALSHVNKEIQQRFGVSVTPNAIVDSMRVTDISEELHSLLQRLNSFCLGEGLVEPHAET